MQDLQDLQCWNCGSTRMQFKEIYNGLQFYKCEICLVEDTRKAGDRFRAFETIKSVKVSPMKIKCQ